MKHLTTLFEDVCGGLTGANPDPVLLGEKAIRLFVAVLRYLGLREREIELIEGQMDYALHWSTRSAPRGPEAPPDPEP